MNDLPFGDAMQCDAFNLAMGQSNEKISQKNYWDVLTWREEDGISKLCHSSLSDLINEFDGKLGHSGGTISAQNGDCNAIEIWQ